MAKPKLNKVVRKRREKKLVERGTAHTGAPDGDNPERRPSRCGGRHHEAL